MPTDIDSEDRGVITSSALLATMDDSDTQRQKAHKTLIDIAGVSKRLHTELARVNGNLQRVSARTRLDKIFVAAQSILAKSLDNTCGTSLDPRLEDWLCSKEPDMCLHILSDMERLIATDLGGRTFWGKVSSAVHSLHTEGRMNEAIKLFNDRQDFFHFLLTPEVWYGFRESNIAVVHHPIIQELRDGRPTATRNPRPCHRCPESRKQSLL